MLLLSRFSKRNYYHTYFELNINNIRKTWEGINLLVHQKKKFDKVITSLKCLIMIVTKNSKYSQWAFCLHWSHISIKTCTFWRIFTFAYRLKFSETPLNKAPSLHSCPLKIVKSAGQLFSKPIEGGIYPSKFYKVA